MEAWIHQLLAWLALPQFGLSTVFIVALISATLLPLGSEPAVAGLLHLNPDLFWQAILVATAGNTLGGAISWWTGALARTAWYKARRLRHAGHGAAPANPLIPATPPNKQSRHQRMARIWLRKFGAKACLLSWLPIVGDPLCAVAGWLRLPFWPCVFYMAIGKFLRYLLMTMTILHFWPGA
ncbi:membrane protein YqaA with SNARE-associated domain [Comamonas sp. BIGb0152]|uniref:YqaA family protein n=1 Tax=Comamonas sp. BIGb0152 TaxID=2940601 RepID=UPI002167A41C|nr:YqaA family protein [Comamonas sp. BIGb0152]MCS4295139.1 membrane protein YqaA with SNARE-associated domain [Comamonas sp. BIGb0152]